MSCSFNLDSTLSASAEQRLKGRHKALIRRLCQEVNFTYNEIESLLIIYYKLQKAGPQAKMGVVISELKEFLHHGLNMTDGRFNNWIITVLDVARTERNIFSIEAWMRALSVLVRGSLEEKIKYCYSVYDRMASAKGMITHSMLNELLQNSIIEESQEEAENSARDLAEIVSLKLDEDRDGRVSFEDYKQAILKQPLFLEALGPCLPSREAACSFLTTFTPYVENVKK